MILIWLKTVWDWLKRNWMWVVFPIGILVVVARFLFSRKTSLPPVLSPGSVEASRVQEVERRAAEAAARKAEEERKAKLAEIERQHGEVLSKLTEEQANRVAELVDDPDELNKFLLQVGKDARK